MEKITFTKEHLADLQKAIALLEPLDNVEATCIYRELKELKELYVNKSFSESERAFFYDLDLSDNIKDSNLYARPKVIDAIKAIAAKYATFPRRKALQYSCYYIDFERSKGGKAYIQVDFSPSFSNDGTGFVSYGSRNSALAVLFPYIYDIKNYGENVLENGKITVKMQKNGTAIVEGEGVALALAEAKQFINARDAIHSEARDIENALTMAKK